MLKELDPDKGQKKNIMLYLLLAFQLLFQPDFDYNYYTLESTGYPKPNQKLESLHVHVFTFHITSS